MAELVMTDPVDRVDSKLPSRRRSILYESSHDLVELFAFRIAPQIPQLSSYRNAFPQSRRYIFHNVVCEYKKALLAELAKHVPGIVPRDIDAYHELSPRTLPAVLPQILDSREVELGERPAEEIGRELDRFVIVHALPYRQCRLEVVEWTEECGVDRDVVGYNKGLDGVGALGHLVARLAEVGRQNVPDILHATLCRSFPVRSIAFGYNGGHLRFQLLA